MNAPHIIVATRWAELDADASRAPDADKRLDDLEDEPSAVLGAAAPLIRPLVRIFVEELMCLSMKRHCQ
jgi:hypothetical protein